MVKKKTIEVIREKGKPTIVRFLSDTAREEFEKSLSTQKAVEEMMEAMVRAASKMIVERREAWTTIGDLAEFTLEERRQRMIYNWVSQEITLKEDC